jgi:hypothetical protein
MYPQFRFGQIMFRFAEPFLRVALYWTGKTGLTQSTQFPPGALHKR